MTLGKTKVSKKVFDLFPALNESTRKQEIFPQIMNTLSGLQLALQYYFPEFAVNNFRWVVNLFGSNESSNLSAEEEQLIDLRNDLFFQTLFPQKNLDEFWLSASKSYSMIGAKAVTIILPFASSWLCEHSFSVLTEIKSCKRERLETAWN